MGDDNIREPLVRPPPPDSSLVRRMYAGHFLARWGARMWEFSVGLYMISIWPDSLLFTAIYGVVESASMALFGSLIGKWVDRLSYAQVLRLWLLTQNMSFMVAGLAVATLLIDQNELQRGSPMFMFLVVLTNISGAIGVLSTLAGTILVEREWVVVISAGQPPQALTKLNSVIRRIDLSCNLLAPVFSGFIISFISLRASAVSLALWNTVAVWLQYWLLNSVYNGIPALCESSQRRAAKLISVDRLEEEGIVEAPSPSLRSRALDWLYGFLLFDAWAVYLKQEVVLPGIALALLYFTVLGFGTMMTAALKWQGVPAYVIAMGRGVSAVIGITATLVYPVAHSWVLTLRTGLWSIWAQSTPFVMDAHGGVAASRLGLWMFDLAVMQQMQDLVPESDRLIVGGVQNSLQSILDLMAYVMGIIISHPQAELRAAGGSVLCVGVVGRHLYTIYIYRVRKHLFHFDKLCSNICLPGHL
ncbi:unnamed protein product [Spirodela intermedia]|uniref:Solute carrier family 40 member n=1 Tax=Spirodela intermedia TaxID=51605 RepID=A0A7I8JIA7_SPIIN|nr:unnamed protein product [Spirodela intermedia]CAA6669283.1 unnamed protein product [Spirodela intermedia]